MYSIAKVFPPINVLPMCYVNFVCLWEQESRGIDLDLICKRVLCRRNRIISKLKSCYWRTTHKFGIKLLHSVKEALRIDEETGTYFWRRAINKEMAKVKVAWKVHEGHTPEQVRNGEAPELRSFQEIRCHCVFDVKMDFTHKCHFITGGHTTETPSSITIITQRLVAFILPCPKADFSDTRPPMMRSICRAGVCSHTGKMNS